MSFYENPQYNLIRLFVASSNELKPLRDNLVIRVTAKNKVLEPRGIRVEVDEWEFVSAAMPESGRSQDTYNKLIGNADIVAVILKNKAGKYTIEEFNTARTLFKAIGKPQVVVYVFQPDKEEDSLKPFLQHLRDKEYFPSDVANEDALWNELNSELDRLTNQFPSNQQSVPPQANTNGRQINMWGGIYNEY